ncbi:OmcA/MtrC family decaheme c-type cytochrome [Ferrimonas sediminicola]|uniref:OmcA/MtrC family decaheme c-type cytochrome n=1 Tax=Ferrimonas sediminicola TaxID=2569538 RepID=A0A4U1BCI8_9GAMM|nr:OmcA/MtrC family decaheme c-type cytochrome [Ferrimonas sediminicola]TKB48686.1 OmcA/MtrC family decaheme c-type cytochrome [Ferrimonas sediminicola]
MKLTRKTPLALMLASAMLVTGCSDGDDGKDGAPGEPGVPGEPGLLAGSFVDTANAPTDLIFTIAPEAVVIEPGKPFSVNFTVTGKNTKGDDVPFVGLDKIALYLTEQVANEGKNGAPYQWINHGTATEFGSSLYCTPTGTATDRRGNEVQACTLMEDAANPGSYSLSWEHDGDAPLIWAGADVNNLHRLMIRSYNIVDSEGAGLEDKVLTPPMDYIPATGELAESVKDIVSSNACIRCHGEKEGRIENIHAHHNYQRVENCVACHNVQINLPDSENSDPDGDLKGFNPNFAPMVHRLHRGHAIEEHLLGDAKAEFGEIGFPADITECSVCHDNGGGWATNIYADACQACHIEVNFETGENHAGIVPQDDSVCAGCHGAGALNPMVAHNVGGRTASESAFEIAVSSVSIDAATGDLTVVFDTTARAADGVAVADAILNDDILYGVIEADGIFNQSGTINLLDGTEADGSYTVVVPGRTELVGQSAYFVPDFAICTDGEDLVACGEEEMKVSATMAPAYWNLANADGSDYVMPRIEGDNVSIEEETCNNCHDNLTWVKLGHNHGANKFTTCVSCHSPKAGFTGSFHSQVSAIGTDADGNDVVVDVKPGQFYNRDLMTVAHRYHSGEWHVSGPHGVFRRVDDQGVMGELNGYPDIQSDCQACHSEGVSLFTANGTLASGKDAIALSLDPFGNPVSGYISPVSESCRSCHVHNNDAAKAHFVANGATLTDAPAGSAAEVSIESCGVCHAEGKTYGIDTVHSGPAH